MWRSQVATDLPDFLLLCTGDLQQMHLNIRVGEGQYAGVRKWDML